MKTENEKLRDIEQARLEKEFGVGDEPNSFPCAHCGKVQTEESGAYAGFTCEDCPEPRERQTGLKAVFDAESARLIHYANFKEKKNARTKGRTGAYERAFYRGYYMGVMAFSISSAVILKTETKCGECLKPISVCTAGECEKKEGI